ncbi:hypothetical protein BB560_006043 [Smittium megazygosporum]|uniref:Retrotransposon gag domain-containing protein n=1 Tax=Smittium megazygosporum TaxID=133381 RepID=A0A2T9YK05_9FUNG|nr:hypothetical protein BB560_006043 [Smittium megazygosporum]
MNSTTLEPEIFTGLDETDPVRWIKRYELFVSTCSWETSAYVEYMDLFLEQRALSWYKDTVSPVSTWEDIKKNFLMQFTTPDVEMQSWTALQSLQKGSLSVEEFKEQFISLARKAKISNESEMLRYVLRAVSLEERKKILKSKPQDYRSALAVLEEDEKLDNLAKKLDFKLYTPIVSIDSSNYNGKSRASKKEYQAPEIVKKEDVMETLITKFNKLSLNLLNIVN